MAINGNNIFISLGSDTTPIAGTKSDEIQVGCTTIDISSPMQGEWEEHIKGRKKWSVSVNFLVLANTDVEKLIDAGKSYTLTIRTSSTGYLTGTATLEQCTMRFARFDVVQGSFNFKGNGALTKVTPPAQQEQEE